jgi:hypothetical protein
MLHYGTTAPRIISRFRCRVRRFRAPAALSIAATAPYVGSYVFISSQGRYEPAIWGAIGVKSYHWAPLGFCHNRHWNRRLILFYGPMVLFDRDHWHRPDDALTGKYPINLQPPRQNPSTPS